MAREWKPLDWDECPECGDQIEVFTDAAEGHACDGDAVRCCVCHWPGGTSVDEDDAFISWCEDYAEAREAGWKG